MADVKGMPTQSAVAPQPVGYASGLRGMLKMILLILPRISLMCYA